MLPSFSNCCQNWSQSYQNQIEVSPVVRPFGKDSTKSPKSGIVDVGVLSKRGKQNSSLETNLSKILWGHERICKGDRGTVVATSLLGWPKGRPEQVLILLLIPSSPPSKPTVDPRPLLFSSFRQYAATTPTPIDLPTKFRFKNVPVPFFKRNNSPVHQLIAPNCNVLKSTNIVEFQVLDQEQKEPSFFCRRGEEGGGGGVQAPGWIAVSRSSSSSSSSSSFDRRSNWSRSSPSLLFPNPDSLEGSSGQGRKDKKGQGLLLPR